MNHLEIMNTFSIHRYIHGVHAHENKHDFGNTTTTNPLIPDAYILNVLSAQKYIIRFMKLI